MANEIKDKFASMAALTKTLALLANGAGFLSDAVSNATNRYQDILLYVCLKMGATAPTANSLAEIYLVRSDADGTAEHIDDGETFNSSHVPANAQLIGALRFSGAANEVVKGSFLIHRPGPKWGVTVLNRSGQALSSTETDHWVRYIGLNPEVQ